MAMDSESARKILQRVNSPADVKALSPDLLPELAQALRSFLVQSVSTNPGHLGSSLGVVEITIALLRVYTPPTDSIIWDVGHQAYIYKLLTERRGGFDTNRQLCGLCGFPSMQESPYDAFGTGHSSTSISAALGIAEANRLLELPGHSVAVIGDGAMTGGLAFEGLNNAGALRDDILVILNDNDMSIDPNVGGLHEYLLDIVTSPSYNRVKDRVWNALSRTRTVRNGVRSIAQQVDRAIKGAFLEKSNLFEALGIRYFGPVDGHDALYLSQILNDLKQIPGPKLLHCITVKGKGFEPAEREQTVWHAPGRFNATTGERTPEGDNGSLPPRYQDVFGPTLLELAIKNPHIVGITPAMPSGSSLNVVMQKYPHRTYDVGIAEGHAVTFSAGLASRGIVPYCVIYSSFLQRAFDQIIHDVALQNLHVVLCLDRAGLVGEDGATHHGAYDLAYLRPIPNMTICAPLDEYELAEMLRLAEVGCGPWAIRYPRGRGAGIRLAGQGEHQNTEGNVAGKSFRDSKDANDPMAAPPRPQQPIIVGHGRRITAGQDIAILSLGAAGQNAHAAVRMLQNKGINAAHYDFRFLKPLDQALLQEVALNFHSVYTVEDGTVVGGFGSAVLEALNGMGYKGRTHILGIPDRFIGHGTVAQLQALCGYSGEEIAKRVENDKRREEAE